MKIISIDKNVVSGQCYNSLARVQILYAAYFIGVGFIPKGWQGLQFGFFAPAHNPDIGYRCVKFYASVLPGIPGSCAQWPNWYRWLKKQFSINLCLLRGFV